VILSVNRLDPQTYASVGVIEVAHGTPTLRTGDVFALEYATNVPGQLRIDNIDSRGQMTPLGTYTVLAGRDNRIPHTKGIKLTGTTGVEIFRLYFFPCNPSEAGGGAPAAAAGLPACPAGPNPQLLQAAKGLVVAKGAVNLESPDPTIAVSAAADYQPNDITQTEFRINHTDAG
jgi:hypothetical protein